MAGLGYQNPMLFKQMATAAKRQNAIEAAIAPHQRVLDKLKQKYGGRSGTYAGPDMERKRAADAAITRLRRGVLPGESDTRVVALAASFDVTASITANAGHHAAPTP